MMGGMSLGSFWDFCRKFDLRQRLRGLHNPKVGGSIPPVATKTLASHPIHECRS